MITLARAEEYKVKPRDASMAESRGLNCAYNELSRLQLKHTCHKDPHINLSIQPESDIIHIKSIQFNFTSVFPA